MKWKQCDICYGIGSGSETEHEGCKEGAELELRCGMMGMIKKMVGCMNGKSIVSTTLRVDCSTHGAAAAASSHARGVGTSLRAVEVGRKGTNCDTYTGH